MIFRHYRECMWGIEPRGGFTIALQEIEPWFFSALKAGDFFEKKIGIAKCHPEENFCKKTGRELAEKNAKLRKLTVTKIVDTIGKREITFEIDGIGGLVVYKPEKAQKVRLA